MNMFMAHVIGVVSYDKCSFSGVFRYMLLVKKKKYASVTLEKKPNGEIVLNTELKG